MTRSSMPWRPLGVPIIGGVDCGYWAPYMPLVNGALAIVELVSDVDKICPGRWRAAWAHRPADRRYDGRALAESAKTLAWRYAMGRTPSRHFEMTRGTDPAVLGTEEAWSRSRSLPWPLVTTSMQALREISFEERRDAYVNGREESGTRPRTTT